MKVGVVINPGTPLVTIEPVLNLVDQVLLMTVNPGFGGQAYIPEVAEKIEALVKLREAKGLNFDIEVDGGIDDKTIHSAKMRVPMSLWQVPTFSKAIWMPTLLN